MKVKKEEELDRAFILTPTDLHKICRYFDKEHNFIFKAGCADKTVRDFTSIDELIKFDNVPKKEIESLGINVYSKDYKKTMFIHFSKTTYKNILVKIEGEDEDVSKFREFLEERFYEMKPWYGFICIPKYRVFIVDMLLLLIFSIPFNLFLNHLLPHSFTNSAAIGLFFGVIFMWIWANIKRTMFPTGVFAIGQGIKRNEDKDKVRTTIVISFLVSLITGIIVAIIFG